MGGGTTRIDLPMIQCKTSSSILPTLSPSSTLNFPVSINNTTSPLTLTQSSCSASSCCCFCLCETVCVHGKEDKRKTGSSYNDVFGPVPSQFEVETAIASLQNFMQGVSSSGLLRVSHGYERVADAFHLLQKDPIVKRLVLSLSSDKALWNAVMNNEMLQQLRGSCLASAEKSRIQGCNQETDDVCTIMLSWIMNMTKARVTELIQNFQSLMSEIFQPPEKGKPAEESREVDDKIRSSLLLSVVILLIVVVARVHRA
eukprot:XP_015584506.1 uncharacterized protein LOC8265826 [Ricinus communis]